MLKDIKSVRDFEDRLLRKLAGVITNDSLYLKLRYRILFGRRLDLRDPRSFNEKLNWMKLHYHNPEQTVLADKIEAKKYVSECIGEQYVVRNLAVWERIGDIKFEQLPDSFILKCTHDSGNAWICTDKSSFKASEALKDIETRLQKNYYPSCREWVYKGIKPRVLADVLLNEGSNERLLDYKFWCFSGVPKYMYITIKDAHIFENFYDMDFNPVIIDHGFERHKPEFEKPVSFELMKQFAAKLSTGFPFVRVDFFEVSGHPYFGECTFYDWGGLQPFADYSQDLELGSLIQLPTDCYE